MNTYVALFRGINVGGKGILRMNDLVAILQNLGAQRVKTYIQSGNAVFRASDKDASRLADKIRREIHVRFGFDPHVLVLERGDIERAIEKNPFPEAEANPKSLHAGFLASAPQKPDLAALEHLRINTERFKLIGTVFYLHAPDGVGRSKLAASAERLLGVPMTDRNWNTVCKISEMARELLSSE